MRVVFGRWLLGWRMAALAGLVALGLLVGGASRSTLPSFTQVSGSPFATAPNPVSVAFSPDGRLLAVVNSGDGTVSVPGRADPGQRLPVATGAYPESVAFSPGRRLLATANLVDATASAYRRHWLAYRESRPAAVRPTDTVGRHRPH